MSKRKRWIFAVLIVIVVAVIIAYPYYRRSRQQKEVDRALMASPAASPGQRVLNVNAEVLAPGPISEKTPPAIGNMIPFEEVDLMFETSGKVVGIFFNEGEYVRKGTLLAKINDAPLQAQLKKLESQIKLAEDRVYRQQTLLEKDAVSEESYQTVVTEYDKLMADIELVKANIAQTELRAPFDGVIGFRYLSEGAFASSNTTVANLAMISQLKVEFPVPERYAPDMRPGKRVSFSMRDSRGAMKEYSATIYAVESSVDLSTRSLRARATYDNSRGEVVPGTFVNIQITTDEIKDAITVPSEAIIPEMGRNIVYVMRGGRAEPVEIETGLRTESRVQAVTGLSRGDTLLTTGVMQLRKGMPVTINNLN